MKNKLNNTYAAFISILNASIRQNNLSLSNKIVLPDNWNALFRLLHTQAVAGVCFNILNLLPQNKRPDQRIYLQWAGIANYIKNTNRRAEKAYTEVCELLAEIHIRPVVMKGLSFGLNYPDPEMRMSGDIDLFIPERYSEVIDFLKEQGYELTSTEKHHKFYYEGTLIELHHHIINKPFKEIDHYETKIVNFNGVDLCVLDIQTQAVLLISHAVTHLSGPGVGYRHLCDWVLFLNKYHQELENPSFIKEIRVRHLEKFLIVFTSLAHQLFNTSVPSIIQQKHESLVQSLMIDMFNQGDCGQVERHRRDQRNIIVYSFMYVKRLLKFLPYSSRITFRFLWMKIEELAGR